MTSRITQKQRNTLEESLIEYAYDKLINPDSQKKGIIRLSVGVVSQALYDLHNGNELQKKECTQFFNSDDYTACCKVLGIDKELMDRIVKNTTSIVEHRPSVELDDDYEELYE